MQTVAEALQEMVEPALTQPGKLNPNIQQLLPRICPVGLDCAKSLSTDQGDYIRIEQKILSRIEQGGYCVRLLDSARHIIALAQFPFSEQPVCLNNRFWETSIDEKGYRYYRTSRVLYTQNRVPWGTLQLARSLEDIETYLFSAQLVLGVGGLLAIALTVAASWWLAGLAMQPVRQSYQQMQQFTADAAHELRTPLASLRAMVQTALKAENLSSQEMQETMRAVDRQSHRLSQLVHNLLLLCQLDQPSPSVPCDRCCLNALVKGLAEDFEALAAAAELSLTLENQTTEWLYILGIEEQLYRCLANLLVNAIQYTPAGGKVTLMLAWHQPYALIQVKDSGIGISLDEQAHIFNRFYRVNRECSRNRGGTGLGLAIARAIAHAHNGSLQVASEFGKGSIFTLRLPLTLEPKTQL